MRRLAALGVAFACAYGCGGDDGPASPQATAGGEGGEAGTAGNVGGANAGESGEGTNAVAGAAPTAGSTASAGAPGGGAASGGAEAGGVGGAGAGGDAGAAGGPPVMTVGIVANATQFLDYGKLRIGFEVPVDAATLTITLAPQRPDRLAVTSVAQVDEATVDATLAYYHLPIDYQINVLGKLPDATSFRATGALSGVNNGSRVAFLSKQTGSGDFTSWVDAPSGATPLEAADAVCQREADGAGLHGKFQAFISANPFEDAGCRALGAAGTIANQCGQGTLPVDHAPILSLQGTPIAAGGTGIIANQWAIPISFYADGSAANPDYTFTGTLPGGIGYADDDCDRWTSTAHLGITTLQIANRLMDYGFGRACTTIGDVVCLQTVGTFFGPSTLHEVSGRRAFVSKGHLYGNMSFSAKTGVAAADALCQSEAQAAALTNADKFHAYLGTADTDALCYILGKTGKVAAHCGLAALPTTDPWRRVDNYPIGTAAELQAGKLQAPLSLAADGTPLVDERPRTGTDQNGATSANCGDWTSTASYSLSGAPGYTTSDWTSHWTTTCASEQTSVYCFEN